tara:strand:- start:144 stop:407 length:264 start_codon:yes stop_codon:yes gene_type:complete
MGSQISIIFIAALIAGIVGSESGHRFKKVERSSYARLAVHFCSGFGGALLAFVILSRLPSFQLPVAIIIGAFYGFFMANAKAYNAIK